MASDTATLLREARDQGWMVVQAKRRSHYHLTHPDVRGAVVVASTAVSPRAFKNARASLRRALKLGVARKFID